MFDATPLPFPALFRDMTPEEVLAVQREALERAYKYLEEAKAGRIPYETRSTPNIIPPRLWNRLREKGWLDEHGEWTELGRKEIFGA